MSTDVDGVLLLILVTVTITAGILGWAYAHETVATECERLGAFYVGDKTFKCERVKP